MKKKESKVERGEVRVKVKRRLSKNSKKKVKG